MIPKFRTPIYDPSLGSDSALNLYVPESSTRVMSPTPIFGSGQGWLQVAAPCPACKTNVSDPFICAGCGSFGHPECLGAELFQDLPVCGACFHAILAEFSARDNAIKREEWRRLKHEQLEFMKIQTIKILNVTTLMGETIGAASATMIGGAINLAKGITTGVLESVQLTGERRPRKIEDITMDDILSGKVKMTAKEYAELGHCTACHTENTNHSAHLRRGDCYKKPVEMIPIPDDADDLAQEDSFQSIQFNTRTEWKQNWEKVNGIWKNKESDSAIKDQDVDTVSDGAPILEVLADGVPVLEDKREDETALASSTNIGGGEDKVFSPLKSSNIGIRTDQTSEARFDEGMISQIFERLDHLTKMPESSDAKLGESDKKVEALTKKVSSLEVTIGNWWAVNAEEEDANLELSGQFVPEDPNFNKELAEELERQVFAEKAEESRQALLDVKVSPGNLGRASQPLTDTGPQQGATGEGMNTVTMDFAAVQRAPPGLMPLQVTPYHDNSPQMVGHGELQSARARSQLQRGFDDVMSFFIDNGGVTNFDRAGHPGQGTSTPTTYHAAATAERPSNFDGPPQQTQASRGAISDVLSNSDLGMILKILQQCIGTFPMITLRGMAERPEDLRKWRYAVGTSLKAAGPHVEQWWKWSTATAESTHKLYAIAPIMNRESIGVTQRTPVKWLQLESWIRPKLIACLPENLKKQLAARGIAGGVEDECQDILYMLNKTCMPGAADEKSAVLKQLQDPVPCSKAESALGEIQRFWQAGRRCKELGMSPPDISVLYTAFRSIFSNVLATAGSNLQLRWMNLENKLNLPYMITHEAMYEVASFVEGELGFLVTTGSKSSNPGLPLTDNQKRAEAQHKDVEKKKAAAAVATAAAATAAAAAAVSPQVAAGYYNNERKKMSIETSSWANPCHDWDKGHCPRGISCMFKHASIPTDAKRCFNCGEDGHGTNLCTAPGGGKDPKKIEVWDAYKERRAKALETKGSEKGKKGGGKGDKGKGKKGGKGETAKSARVSAVISSEKFPEGGVGLDSWANVHLIHVASEEFSSNSSLKLASGDCECDLSTGLKGMPVSKVPMKKDGENIDLLPLGWLWSRGCDYGWNKDGPSLRTPKGRYLQVLMWDLLPFITKESFAKLEEDLPEANVPGRVKTARIPHASSARASKTVVDLSHLNGEVEHDDLKKYKAKYRCLPEVYYGDEEQYVKPKDFQNWMKESTKENFDAKDKPMFSLWEWYAGSGTLSKVAADGGVSHMPPIDYRYGWSISNLGNQLIMLYALLILGVESLFAAPNCFPWGRDSKASQEDVRVKKRSAEKNNLRFLTLCCFLQILLGRGYYVENPKGSDIFVVEESPLSVLRTLPFGKRVIDQCMRGAELEDTPVKKATDLQSNKELKDDVICDATHQHLPLRGTGPGGSRTAQSAKYTEELCTEYLEEMIPSPKANAGGRIVDCSGMKGNADTQAAEIDFQKICKALNVLKTIAIDKGYLKQWTEIVDPWLAESGLDHCPHTAASALGKTGKEATTERAATGLTDVFESIKGDLSERPWQELKYDKNNKHWQGAAQRRHLHRRHANQSIGVASVDLSGPHLPTPQPGKRSIGSSPAYYFLVLTVKLAEEEAVQEGEAVEEEQPENGVAVEDQHILWEQPPELISEEPWVKPILYAALLEKKSDATRAIQSVLAQAKAEIGTMPKRMIYRLHSDLGGEFLGPELQKYLLFHAIQHTTTQGYDPSSNGAAENAVGLLKKRARYLLSGNRFSTNWWGVCILASAHLYRWEAGYASPPLVPFGTRVMVNIDPVPRDAFMPRSLPATVFGPSEGVPGGCWVYQAGRIVAKCNVKVQGLTEAELTVVRATWSEYEPPIAPLPAPDSHLYDATDVVFPTPRLAATSENATCPACKFLRNGQPVSLAHSLVWGECSQASIPPKPMSALLPHEDDPEQPMEGLKPEELPNPVLVRPEELVESLGVSPELSPSMPVASRVSQNTNTDTDAVDLLLMHPHAAIAWSEESSIAWQCGHSSVTESQSEGGVATRLLETDSDITDKCPELCSDSESDVHVIGNAGSDSDTDDTLGIFDCEDSLDRLFRPPNRRLQKKVRRRVTKFRKKITQCDSVFKAAFCRAAAAMLGADGEYHDVPDEAIHGLVLESDILDPASRTVQPKEVRESVGIEAEGWRAAMEKEYNDNFLQRNVFTVTTEHERRTHGTPLPMKLVFTLKQLMQKCRAVVCGNFERNPTTQLWTAQAEVASLIAAVRIAVSLKWQIGAVDVSGAFMYAPLPENMLVVVRPPQFFIDCGLAKPGELWTLCRAVYGLKISPKAWGLCRDKEFRNMHWKVGGDVFVLLQCTSDTQVWRMVNKKDPSSLLGLVVVYVDVFLILSPAGLMRQGLIIALRAIWNLKHECILGAGSDLTFLGLEFTYKPDGVQIGQRKFTEILLEKHGFSVEKTKPISSITMDAPGEIEIPSPAELRQLQGFAGEFNWLATRSRADISYFVSLLSSALTKFSSWSFTLAKKILRYLLGTRDTSIFLPASGDLTDLTAWSDAGFAGISTKSQTGMLLMWGGAILLWRSSRQSVPALSTAEAELIAASMTWQVIQGVRILLEEWGCRFEYVRIKADNTAAITIATDGSNWRTRYFSVRGARLNHEILCGSLKLEHEPTLKMLADSLTKLGTGQMLLNTRNAMVGILVSGI